MGIIDALNQCSDLPSEVDILGFYGQIFQVSMVTDWLLDCDRLPIPVPDSYPPSVPCPHVLAYPR